MSEMVERVARAIFGSILNVDEGWLDADGKLDPNRIDLITRQRWFDCRDAARVAIAAMLEPTEAMLRAGWDEVDFDRARWWQDWDEAGPNGETSGKQDILDAWRAMIDAALKE